jgi:phosphatidylglycerol---prolipoprotein diacylglyceryl transferase
VSVEFYVWDPSRIAFSVPFLDFPIAWYSLFFAFGLITAFSIGRFVLVREFGKDKSKEIELLLERFTIYLTLCIIIGARLGHVLFYDPSFYFSHPVEIFKIWEGGLASHGATVGVFVAVWLFQRKNTSSWFPRGFDFIDFLTIETAWVCTFIRVGNFFNQEIVGTVSSLPWAIIFEHPMDCEGGLPRHPVQLYEALFYFLLFIFSFFSYRKFYRGTLSGIFLIVLFSFRFLIEFLKVPQCSFDAQFVHMGQLLSIPFVALGIYFVLRSRAERKKNISRSS